MASTKLEDVLGYLHEKLTEELETTVIWGPPVGDDQPAKLVSVGFGPDGESGDSNREWRFIGNQELDETITVEIAAQAISVGATSMKTPYTASRELAAEVENVIREDITLGDNVFKGNTKLSRWRGRYFRADKAPGHRFFLTLTGTARI